MVNLVRDLKASYAEGQRDRSLNEGSCGTWRVVVIGQWASFLKAEQPFEAMEVTILVDRASAALAAVIKLLGSRGQPSSTALNSPSATLYL
jgi:hypothetical protein